MPPIDPQALALVAVLTVPGLVTFAPIVTGLIEMLKRLRVLGVPGNEARTAALVSAIFVVLGLASAIQQGMALDLGTLFVGFTAWYGLTTITTSIYDDLVNAPGSTRAQLVQPN